MFYLLLFTLPIFIVLFITPVNIKFAIQKNILDEPLRHKTHTRAKPLLGGLAIFISFSIVVAVFLPLDSKLLSMAIASAILIMTGLLDDIYNIKPLLKLTGQTIAASIVVLWNLHLFRFMLDYFSMFNLPGTVVIILIIGWIVLIINAFNLIDGLDGLAAGTAAIIFLAMSALSAINEVSPNMLGVQLIGAGACIGFLRFNYNPARIFMGDTGSMLLGFILATTHLFTIKYPFSAHLVLGSMFIFAYPALDLSYAIFRRIRLRIPIFDADKGHIHHVLLSFHYSVKKTVCIIYVVNILFSSLAIVLLSLNMSSLFLIITGLLTVIGITMLFRSLIIVSDKKEICNK